MSSTTNTPYMTKSMNGIIVISDGAGVTIENGTIIAPTIDITNLNIDEIQGTAPTNNIALYTDTTIAQVTLGAPTTAIVNVNANDTNILAGSSVYISSGTTTSVLASTINLISNEVIVGGGQEIYQQNTAGNFTIGGNVTARNFYLGNSSFPPQVSVTATQSFDVVNYDTCVALIGGGGSGQLYADDIYTFTSPSTFVSLWTDCTAGILIGNNTITNTCSVAVGCNNGSLALGTISNRSADTFIATGESHSGNVYIHSGQNSSGNLYLACNNYVSTSGSSTTSVNIGGASTSTRYNGTVNICAFNPSSGTNNLNLGSASTVNTQRGSSLNLNSTNASSNVVTIGSSTTTSSTMVATDINVNSTNGLANTVDIGSAQTTATHLGSTIAINSTNGSSNTVSIGSSTSTINLGSSTATVINSFPISPVSASITYSTTTGTQIVGSIGYILQGTLVSNGGLTSTTTYNMGTMVIDKGVWMVTGNVGYSSGASTNLHEVSIWLATSAIDDDFNGFMTSGVITANRTAEIGTRGIWSFDSLSTLRLRFRVDYTGSGMNQNNVNWAFKAVRIA
jgi:hypothetical protein